MFAVLGLSPEVVRNLNGKPMQFNTLKRPLTFCPEQFHIYMASNSRISIAGLNTSNVDYVAASIKECLKIKQT